MKKKDDIMERMGFTHCVSKTLKMMDNSIFN
jgi:acyl CoA:acetate/3-ketoacid CoA transferase